MSRDAGVHPSDNATELQTLLRKLSDIGGEIERNRQHLEQLALEFNRVDSVIRAATGPSRPDARPQVADVLPERSVPNMIRDVLAGARNPVSAREIAEKILEPQRVDGNYDARLKAMTHRVCVSLWVQNQKGVVRKIEQSSSRFRWELVRD